MSLGLWPPLSNCCLHLRVASLCLLEGQLSLDSGPILVGWTHLETFNFIRTAKIFFPRKVTPLGSGAQDMGASFGIQHSACHGESLAVWAAVLHSPRCGGMHE